MERHKFPRIPHLPWSPGATSDDKIIKSMSQFEDMDVVITEKRDGENTSLYPDGYVHARSIDGTGKEYQSYLITRWHTLRHNVHFNPNDVLCVENLYAKHSIEYTDLKDYFELFGAFYKNKQDNWVYRSWVDVKFMSKMLGIPTVPILYEGRYDYTILRKMCLDVDTRKMEGLVIRSQDSFFEAGFDKYIAKYVREGHVTTDKHWTKNWTKNSLRKEE